MPNYQAAIVLTLCCAISLDAKETASVDSDTQSLSHLASTHETRPSFASLADLSQQVRSLLRKHAESNSVSDQVALTLDMVSMVKQLSSHPRFPRSRQLKKLRTSLFTRLRSIRKDVEADIRRQKRICTLSASKSVPKKIEINPTVLAQLNQVANGNANQLGGNNANGGVVPDYAPMLIDIIQQTISPPSWDVFGGASTIQYWRPGRALVVRAPDELHREISPLLLQLRK